MVRALLAARADVNAEENDGSKALTMALENNHQDLAQVLKSAGAKDRDPNKQLCYANVMVAPGEFTTKVVTCPK